MLITTMMAVRQVGRPVHLFRQALSRHDAEVIETLASVACSNEVIDNLSGGWKMKPVRASTVLLKAATLLFYEPTNLLDVVNVTRLENYLTSLKTCTSIIVIL